METTGLDLERDEIISVGAVPVESGTVRPERSFYSLVRPGRPVGRRAAELHGIGPAELADAPSPHDVAAQLGALLAGRLVVAHAAWFDTAFLQRLAKATRIELPDPVVDTASLSRAAGVVDPAAGDVEPPLELIARRLGLPVHRRHHALEDALTTASIFLSVGARLEQTPPVGELSVGMLYRISRRYEQARIGPHPARHPHGQ